MDATQWAWIITAAVLGGLILLNVWILVGLQMNLLRKLDKMEDRLMAMSEAYPHAAMVELQKKAYEARPQAEHLPLEATPDWQTQAAS